jgi:hypothetical protein
MARGDVTIPLAPHVLVGTRFRYAPYKDMINWDFYVESVTHSFVFGGESTTSLSLTRGLPSSIYADASDDGLLKAIMVGDAMRLNGRYTKGLPEGSEKALQFFATVDQAAELNQHLATVNVTPQVKP